MILHIHLHHALGKRQYRFEPGEQALIVGRAAGVHIQVPSAAVGREHCRLFLRDGRWWVQDLNSRLGTFLNGQKLPMDEAAKLRHGDVLRLGDEKISPVMQVRMEKAPAVAATAEVATITPPQEAEDLSADSPDAVAGFEQDDVVVDAQLTRAAHRSNSGGKYYVPASAAMSLTMRLTAVLFVTAVVGGLFLVFYKLRDRIAQTRQAPITRVEIIERPPIILQPTTRVVQRGTTGRVFETVRVAQPPATSPAPAPSAPAAENTVAAPAGNQIDPPNPAALQPPPAAAEPTQNPQPDPPAANGFLHAPAVDDIEEGWAEVLEAHELSTPAAAIILYHDFRAGHPESKNLKQLDQFTDDALEQLWLERYIGLYRQHTEAEAEMQKIARQWPVLPPGEQKKQLAIQRERLTVQVAQIQTQIQRDLGVAPAMLNAAAAPTAQQLLAGRNAAVAGQWKQQVLQSLVRTRGVLPWKSN